MLGLAGLAFAACSSDDEVTSAGLDGDAVVRVNIVTAGSTRAVDDPITDVNGDNKQDVEIDPQKGIVITLVAEQGGTIQRFESVADAEGYVFKNVRNPKSISVSINGGTEEELKFKDIHNVGLKAPMFASTTNFGVPTEVENPDKDNAKIKQYTVNLTPEHKLALVEFSNIKHIDTDVEGKPIECAFKTINLNGVFLNEIKETESTPELLFTAWTGDNSAKANNADQYLDSQKQMIFEKIGENGENFIEDGKQWPETGKCFAYNIIGKTTPKLTLSFNNIATKPGYDFYNGLTEGYAVVKRYKLNNVPEEFRKELDLEVGDYIKTFKPGFVYRINEINVPDRAIGPSIKGGEDVQILVATVTVHPWKLVSGTVEWN